RWNGAALFDDPEAHRARLHYLGHLDGVQPLLKVSENLKFWAGLRGAGGAGRQAGGPALDEVVEGALEAFGLAHLADIPCRFLSDGQRRRLALARIIATNAALWLLDEPTVGLDSDAVLTFERAVTEHRAGGGMVVVATHAPVTPEDAPTLELSAYATAPGGAVADEAI
ncbi:MAG: ATP-binding cassette domain-containing protein, partial [Alphaproteobacteria bacterium]